MELKISWKYCHKLHYHLTSFILVKPKIPKKQQDVYCSNIYRMSQFSKLCKKFKSLNNLRIKKKFFQIKRSIHDSVGTIKR